MITKFKSIKISFLLVLLIISLTLSGLNTASAQDNSPIVLKSNIYLDWDSSELDDPVVVRNEIRQLDVIIEYSLTSGLPFSYGMFLNYINYKDMPHTVNKNRPEGAYAKGKIFLEVLETPSWCHATFIAPYVSVNLSQKYITKTTLYLNVDEDAPAYSSGYILIKATLPNFNPAPIEGTEQTINLTFKTSYLASISVDLPDVNVAEIQPNEEAVFPINVENLGNDKTTVRLRVSDVPSGWSAIVTDELYLDENESEKATLEVVPPKDFGYREDVGIIRLTLTPARTYNLSELGDNVTLSFLVQSRGLFAEGEGAFPFLGIVIFFFIIIVIIRLITRRKFRDF